MWTTYTIKSDDKNWKFNIHSDGKPISHREFLELLIDNDNFIRWYNSLLANCSFEAFFWENKPVVKQNLNEIYECSLVKSEFLSKVEPDSQTFRSYFKETSEVVTFPNLGGDATLIAPCPVSDTSKYTQIGSFVREAPQHQILKLWQKVGEEILNKINSEPRWVSTSGLGVFWLHIRIDSTPKYYQTAEYKNVSSTYPN